MSEAAMLELGMFKRRKVMALRQPRYNREAHAAHGDDIYQKRIRAQVESGNVGKIVAIDIDSGTFELGDNTLAASQRLLARCPQAQIWCVSIGYPAVHRFGPRALWAKP